MISNSFEKSFINCLPPSLESQSSSWWNIDHIIPINNNYVNDKQFTRKKEYILNLINNTNN
ncbi:MAG: hypothetical protein HDR43_00425 [Mycoplasma sp.]|nr:hypothetical protein [Mycoplasma sp.]